MRNACELEIDLFCHGLRLPAGVPLTGARAVSRTRAGLGSGLEMAIPVESRFKREIFVNVPVAERFAQGSPYRWTEGRTAVMRSSTTATARDIPCGCRWNPRGTRGSHPAMCQ